VAYFIDEVKVFNSGKSDRQTVDKTTFWVSFVEKNK